MYRYKEAMVNDVLEVIRNEYTLEDYESREQLEERLNDELWVNDSVTGNGSGSYTFDRVTAQSFVVDNIDLVKEAVDEFGLDSDEVSKHFLDENWEWFDVTIRCMLLNQAISEALDIIEEIHSFEREDEDPMEEEDEIEPVTPY